MNYMPYFLTYVTMCLIGAQHVKLLTLIKFYPIQF